MRVCVLKSYLISYWRRPRNSPSPSFFPSSSSPLISSSSLSTRASSSSFPLPSVPFPLPSRRFLRKKRYTHQPTIPKIPTSRTERRTRTCQVDIPVDSSNLCSRFMRGFAGGGLGVETTSRGVRGAIVKKK
uniref:Uncharacterized protein n=1 Tax=Lepeophtheirus salmonis TaxID=72036 RepID=A0A0K2UYA5_LEPSM